MPELAIVTVSADHLRRYCAWAAGELWPEVSVTSESPWLLRVGRRWREVDDRPSAVGIAKREKEGDLERMRE